jgi:hypothetical protein
LQLPTPCALEHTCPQWPQLFGSLFKFWSHDPMLAQSPKPELHEETPHRPAWHVAVPPFAGQANAQVPQWVESVFKFVSHPLLGSKSQSAKPGAQVGLQPCPASALVVQAVVPWSFVHSTPQPPQCAVESSAVSQPSSELPLQSARPAAQLGASQPPSAVHASPPASTAASTPASFVRA